MGNFIGLSRDYGADWDGMWEEFLQMLTTVTDGIEAMGAISTSTHALTTGAKTFALIPSARAFPAGEPIRAVAVDNGAVVLRGTVDPSSVPGSVVVNVTQVVGTGGPYHRWLLMLAGPQGPAGTDGTDGTNGLAGPAWWTPTGIKTAAYTAVSGEMVFVNTTGGAVTISLPATPATNARVAIFDVGRAAASNAITVNRNGATIDGAGSNVTVTRAGQLLTLIYTGATWATDRTRQIDVYQVACSNLTSTLTTGTNKAYFRLPFAGTLITYRASLLTASSSGALTVDVNLNGTTTMSATKLTVNASATTSVSATQPVLTTTATVDDDVIAIDIDAAGTGAVGLIVTIYHLRG